MSNLGLESEAVNLSVKLLSELLREHFMLFGNILNAHWNIEGRSFISLHKLLEEHYEFAKDTCDSLAERIRVFGIKAPAHQSETVQMSQVNELSENNDIGQFIKKLSGDYEKVICLMRQSVQELSLSHDYGTKSLLESQLLELEKRHWELISNQ